MMGPGETDLIQSRRGSENSQAKEPVSDKTLESVSTKEAIPFRENLSGKIQRRKYIFLPLFYVKGEIIWNLRHLYMTYT